MNSVFIQTNNLRCVPRFIYFDQHFVWKKVASAWSMDTGLRGFAIVVWHLHAVWLGAVRAVFTDR